MSYTPKIKPESHYERFDNERPVFAKRTERELHRAFDAVANPTNWKLAVEADIPAEGVDEGLIADAVAYFTGSLAEVYPHPTEKGWLCVDAAGYYACIGS
jgi:hypothetical protein